MAQAQAQEKLQVRSQLIPLDGMRLVLPNTAIAEVISLQAAMPVEDGPDWIMGTINWRGLDIPVIIFEAACNATKVSPSKSSRIVVLNALGENAKHHFYGLLVQGIPRLISLDDTIIHDAPDIDGQPEDYVLRHTIIDGQQVIIPDQQALEKEMAKLNLS